MKNGFVLACLVLAAGCSTAVAAEALGVLPSPVSDFLTFPAVLGWSAAAGVVAIAFNDYGRSRRYDESQARKSANKEAQRASDTGEETSWIHQTISA